MSAALEAGPEITSGLALVLCQAAVEDWDREPGEARDGGDLREKGGKRRKLIRATGPRPGKRTGQGRRRKDRTGRPYPGRKMKERKAARMHGGEGQAL